MSLLYAIAERSILTYVPIATTYLLVSVGCMSAMVLWRPSLIWYVPAVGIGAFFLFELLLRAVLYLAYGSAYRFAVFNYFLVDDSRYGTAFPKSVDTRVIAHRVFDVFVFPPGTPRLPALSENKRRRNVFTVNSLGFRGAEFDPKQKKARLRVFCLGGSTTACDSVDDTETWPAQLEVVLRERGFDVEVINAGVQGWGSYQDSLRFAHEIANYTADIALLHHGWNDEFKYASQRLGQKWKKNTVRNVREEHTLYCPPSRFLSSTRFITKYLAIQAWRKRFIFNRDMSFENPRRWEMLLRPQYIVEWFESVIRMARLAQEKHILLYTIDYPALVSMDDTQEDRSAYVAGSRLTPLFADYQAASKARIAHMLQTASAIIPKLDAVTGLLHMRGKERLELFHDEMHTTPRGGRVLAEAIASSLIADPAFIARYTDTEGRMGSNVDTDAATLESVAATVAKNPSFIDGFVRDTIVRLDAKRTKRSARNIPDDRYTTF